MALPAAPRHPAHPAVMQQELENREVLRLQTIRPGSIIGSEEKLNPEFHQHAESVVLDEASTFYRLSQAALVKLKEEDGPVAIRLQEFLLGYLADQYTRSTQLAKELFIIEQ